MGYLPITVLVRTLFLSRAKAGKLVIPYFSQLGLSLNDCDSRLVTFSQLFKTKSTLFLSDKEVEYLWAIILEGF